MRRRENPFLLNGDAHSLTLRLRVEPSHKPLSFFKLIAPIIPESAITFHPMPSRRILYVGHDLALLLYLRRTLADCGIVRSPGDSTVFGFIARINYALILCDEELPYTTSRELVEFNCALERQPCTPFIIIKKSDEFELVARAIREVFARA